ncbi:MAG: hemerythrin domain-containing protein [Chloroflexia bacterium]
MITPDEDEGNPRGEALVQELLWIHGIIRDNLNTISKIVGEINDGAPAGQIRSQIDDLTANSAVWRLRVNCLHYCRLVHGHHHLEDMALFPGLRRANPDLCPVIDKLEADHVVVGEHLDRVEAAVQCIATEASARANLASALIELGEHLLAHLDYEEAGIAPTLRRLNDWPHA